MPDLVKTPVRKKWNRLYADAFDKCSNCGKNLYGTGFTVELQDRATLFCSDWCVE